MIIFKLKVKIKVKVKIIKLKKTYSYIVLIIFLSYICSLNPRVRFILSVCFSTCKFNYSSQLDTCFLLLNAMKRYHQVAGNDFVAEAPERIIAVSESERIVGLKTKSEMYLRTFDGE